jgi:hypothetical protein
MVGCWLSLSPVGLRESRPTLDPSRALDGRQAWMGARLEMSLAREPARIQQHHTGTVHHTMRGTSPIALFGERDAGSGTGGKGTRTGGDLRCGMPAGECWEMAWGESGIRDVRCFFFNTIRVWFVFVRQV